MTKTKWTLDKELARIKKGQYEHRDMSRKTEEKWLRERIGTTLATKPGGVAGVLSRLGSLFGDIASVAIIEGDSSAWRTMHEALAHVYWGHRLHNLTVRRDPKYGKPWRIDYCLAFCLCYAYHLDEEASWLATTLVDGVDPEKAYFGDDDWSPYVPFVIQLAARWLKRDVDCSRIQVTRKSDVYLGIWNAWESPEKIALALTEACDYHVANGGTVREKDFMEFFGGMDSAIGAEILSIIRLRQELGLSTGPINHPCFASPLHSPPNPLPPYKNELLCQVVTEAKKCFPDL